MHKRKSIGNQHSMVVQPSFIIGTYNEDGVANFAPITWVSVTWNTDHYMLVISMNGTKKTKMNAERNRALTANLVSTNMLELMDYLGSASGADAQKDALPYAHAKATAVNAPALGASRWVYECEVSQILKTGDTATYFCKIMDVQIDEGIDVTDGYELADFDPVVYSGNYYRIGEKLGKIGEVYKP